MRANDLGRTGRDLAKRSAYRLLRATQRIGIDVLPRHYYSEIPDLNDLAARVDWRVPRTMVGVRGAGLDQQIKFLDDTARSASGPPTDLHQRAVQVNGQGGGYGEMEAWFLWSFIQVHRPQRVVQIGCGVSTAVILEAAAAAGHVCELNCIEPHPSAYLEQLASDGTITLIAKRAQDVPIEVLTDVGAGGLLFIDSTHTVKPDSEVNRIVFEVFPRLSQDSWVHVHDVYFPYDYGPLLLDGDLFFWSESPLLHAYLIHNDRMSIALSQSAVHHERPEAFRRWYPGYRPQKTEGGLTVEGQTDHFPASTYLRVSQQPASRQPVSMSVSSDSAYCLE